MRRWIVLVAAFACGLAQAQAPLFIESPATVDPGAYVPPALELDCKLGEMVSHQAFQGIAAHFGKGTQPEAGAENLDAARVLRLRVVTFRNRTAWSNVRGLGVRADLLVNGKPVDATVVQRSSLGGVLGPLTITFPCLIMERITETLGKDLGIWIATKSGFRPTAVAIARDMPVTTSEPKSEVRAAESQTYDPVKAAAAMSTPYVPRGPLPNPILNPGAPWAYAGFVVNAPEGTGWTSQLKTQNASAVGKGIAPDHTFVMMVNNFPVEWAEDRVEMFAAYFRERRSRQEGMGRFDFLSHTETAVVHQGQPCSRYLVTAKDRGAAGAPIVLAGITCRHPENPKSAIDVGYSERGRGDTFSPDLQAAGERFISTLRFLAFDPKPAHKEARAFVEQGNIAAAKALLVPLADAGDLRAIFELGQTLMLKSKAPEDHVLARKYLRAGAENGVMNSLFNLGVAHYEGIGGPIDLGAAILWFTRAADQRDDQAQLNLGLLHRPGTAEGVTTNLNAANAWLRMSADNGNERARKILAR